MVAVTKVLYAQAFIFFIYKREKSVSCFIAYNTSLNSICAANTKNILLKKKTIPIT